jgi:5-methylcytosine-specific restriction endonuclease McrA
MEKIMYYLDLTSLYVRTTKEQRIAMRRSYDRDKEMSYKLKLQKNMCFWCGDSIDMTGHLDHVIPIYRGGLNRSSNLVASCRSCNLTKGVDQIEITNPRTINDYLRLIEARKRYLEKCRAKGVKSLRHKPRKVQLYGVYHASLFRSV